MIRLPKKGNRNTALTIYLGTLIAGCWLCRGITSGDWSGMEWLGGTLSVIAGAHAHRARGEYASESFEADNVS